MDGRSGSICRGARTWLDLFGGPKLYWAKQRQSQPRCVACAALGQARPPGRRPRGCTLRHGLWGSGHRSEPPACPACFSGHKHWMDR